MDVTRELPGWLITIGTRAVIIYAETRDDAKLLAPSRLGVKKLPLYGHKIRAATIDDLDRFDDLGRVL